MSLANLKKFHAVDRGIRSYLMDLFIASDLFNFYCVCSQPLKELLLRDADLQKELRCLRIILFLYFYEERFENS